MNKIILILLLISLMTTGCSTNEQIEATNSKYENSNVIYQNSKPNVVKRQEFDGIVFDSIVLKTNNTMSYLTAKVTNNKSEKISLKYVEIITYDETGKELAKFYSYIGDFIESNQTLNLSSKIEGNLLDVYSIKFKVIY